MFVAKLEIILTQSDSGPLSKFLKEEIMRKEKLLGTIKDYTEAVKENWKGRRQEM